MDYQGELCISFQFTRVYIDLDLGPLFFLCLWLWLPLIWLIHRVTEIREKASEAKGGKANGRKNQDPAKKLGKSPEQ